MPSVSWLRLRLRHHFQDNNLDIGDFVPNDTYLLSDRVGTWFYDSEV